MIQRESMRDKKYSNDNDIQYVNERNRISKESSCFFRKVLFSYEIN
jgi:hypothetical protein